MLSISVISEDLDSLIERLAEDGVVVGEEHPIHANFTGIEISDPQGNVVYVLRAQ